MIRVTKFDGHTMILNAEWIQSVEETPDTVITLTTGFKLLVKDSAADVLKAFKNYKLEQQTMLTTILRKDS